MSPEHESRRRRALRLLGLAAAVCLAAAGGRAEDEVPGPEDEAAAAPVHPIEETLRRERVSVDFAAVPLGEAVGTLQDAAWVNMVVAPEVDVARPVTLEAEAAPLGEVVDRILEQTELRRAVWCDVIYVHPPGSPPAPPPVETIEGALPGYTVNLADTPVSEALALLADLSGVAFAVAPPAAVRAEEARVTLRLRNLPLHHVLTLLTRRVGLAWRLEADTVHVERVERTPGGGPLDVPVTLSLAEVPLDEAARALAEAGGVGVRLELEAPGERVVTLDLQDVPLGRALDELVSGRGLAWRLESQVVVIHSRPGKW